VVERQLDGLKFRLLTRPATQDIVLVEIDARSLSDFGVWPWPRRLHAIAARQLLDAGAARVAFDVDFSTFSTDADDAEFAQMLENSGGRVILPVFQQRASHGGVSSGLVDAVPVDIFRPYVDLADLNVIPSDDGRVREMYRDLRIGGQIYPSLAALLAGVEQVAFRSFAIDFGIDPTTVPRLSFTDVVSDIVAPEDVAGKIVVNRQFGGGAGR
jgi:CHASE2 domain-containing sensor protein